MANKRIRKKMQRATLEGSIVELSIEGRLAPAARRAVARQLRAGLSIVIKRGDDVIRQHPDGTIERIKTLPPAPGYELPPGVRRIVGRTSKHR